MKRVFCIIMVVMLTLGLAACAAPAAEKTAGPKESSKPDAIVFNDPVLEAKVRISMNKPEGGITVAEAEAATELQLSNEWQQDMPEEIMIKDISALKYFINLRELDIEFNAVADIRVLEQLQKLELLKLRGNAISDLSPIAGLENLSVLQLQYNQIADVSPLAGLKNLKDVWLSGNTITDYSPLKDIYPNLRQKDFDIIIADDVPDEPIVISDPKLETALRKALGIQDEPITQKDAYQIQSLQLSSEQHSDTAFSDITALSYFVNLRELYMDGNNISDLSPLSNLTKLKVLTFEWNKVSDISPLAGLTQLEQLAAKQNGFSDLSALAGLTNIWELDIACNQISDVSPLAGLKNLRSLGLRENQISDYSPLKEIYPNLEGKDFEIK